MTQQKFKGDNISSMNIMKLKFNTALQYEIEVIIQQTYFFLGFQLLSNDVKKEKEKKKTFQNQFIFVQNILYITQQYLGIILQSILTYSESEV